MTLRGVFPHPASIPALLSTGFAIDPWVKGSPYWFHKDPPIETGQRMLLYFPLDQGEKFCYFLKDLKITNLPSSLFLFC
jgi:hypothetical protein